MYIFHKHFPISEMEFLWFMKLLSSFKALNSFNNFRRDQSYFYNIENTDFMISGRF